MDPCVSTSFLDCGTCTSNRLIKIDGRSRCNTLCASTGERCRRLSLDITDFSMCLQHCVMKADQLTRKQHKALLSFIATGSMTNARKREYAMMIRGRSLPFTCPSRDCDQPRGIPQAPNQSGDNGTISSTFAGYVSLEYSNLHVRNQDLIDAVVGLKFTCLLQNMNTQEDFPDDTLYLYLEELFHGCIFQRGHKQTTSFSKSIVDRIRLTVTTRIGPTNTEIIQSMQKIWIDGHYEDTVDTLFRPMANVVRRTRHSTDNLLHMGLYIILTQIHHSNVKRDLFKPPEDFPVFLSPSVRGRLSCLSRYLEAAMYTMFPNGMMSAVPGMVSTCNICSKDDVVCLHTCTVGTMSPFAYLEHVQKADDEDYRTRRSNRQ